MSVIVKGMKMPENCDVCMFSDWSNLHQTAACKICEYNPCFDDFSREHLSKRANFCPLAEIPPRHGRLIDGDALHLPTGEIASRMSIRCAPTVIEAEDE